MSDMKASMKISAPGQNRVDYFTCIGRGCDGARGDDLIPLYYTTQQAIENGWRFVKCYRIEPDKLLAMCHRCAKGFMPPGHYSVTDVIRGEHQIDLGPRLVTIKEVADIFVVSVRTINRWIKAGALEPIRVGRQWRFKLDEIERIKRDGVVL